jgi:hypothetical protein
MELDTSDGAIDDPQPGDITRVIAEAASDPDWSITLSDDHGYVEASRRDDELFALSRHDGTTRYDATEPVDAETLKASLLAYLGGDKRWRKRHDWVRAAAPAKTAAASGEPPAWAIAAVVASIAIVVVASNLPRDWVPFLDTTPGIVALFSLPFLALIGAAIANVAIKMHRAKAWLQTQGKITRSQLAVRRPPAGSEIGTAVNVPDIAYAFSVAGQSYRGQRVSLGDISGSFAEEAVRRYPVGAKVTVYYDPRDPTDCVLERGLVAAGPDPDAASSEPATAAMAAATPRSRMAAAGAPKADATGCLPALPVLAALGVGGYWLANGGVQELQTRMPRAEVPAMLCAIGFGLVVLLFFIGYRRYLMRANAWPVVPGRVTVSRVEERRGDDGGARHRSYEAVVEYRYQVGGLSFSSRQIALGLRMSGSRTGADAIVTRYPTGATVEVHHDPTNPSEAALENPTGRSWILLAIALACFGIAVYASRILR